MNSLPIGFLIDVYTGLGKGKVNNTFRLSSDSFLKMNKAYVQIGVHWQDEYIGFSVVNRFGQVYFQEGVFNGNSLEGHQYFTYLQRTQKQPFSESSIKLFAGTKKARGYINLIIVRFDSDEIVSNPNRFLYTIGPLHTGNIVNLGVVMNVDEIFKSFKKKKD